MHKSRESIDKQQRAMKNDMRSITELLTILRDHIIKHGISTGMCERIRYLCSINLITSAERDAMGIYILEHKPRRSHNYWWNIGESKPRIEWLNRQIRRTGRIWAWLWAALVIIAAVIAGHLMWTNPVS